MRAMRLNYDDDSQSTDAMAAPVGRTCTRCRRSACLARAPCALRNLPGRAQRPAHA
ncbi:MAG: hypothetical protein ABWZ64_05205 [Xanthobacteraceae bacterium]